MKKPQDGVKVVLWVSGYAVYGEGKVEKCFCWKWSLFLVLGCFLQTQVNLKDERVKIELENL